MKRSTIFAIFLLLSSPLFAQKSVEFDVKKHQLGTASAPVISICVKSYSFEKIYFVFSYMNSLLSKQKPSQFSEIHSHFKVGFSYRF